MTTDARELEGFIDVDSETGSQIERERLYRLWEEHNWSARNLDFRQDTLDWREKITEQQRTAILWNYAMFLDGEESVTVTLAPFLNAVARYEDRIYLATQIADEARHHVFFDRFLREVCQIGQDYQSTLEATRPHLSWGYQKVFTELDRVSDALRRNPTSSQLLAQGITLYHLVIEGMLAHTGQYYLRDFSRKNACLPGFEQGINMTARDESRHIAFGIQLLHELIAHEQSCKAVAIKTLNRVLPWAAGVFVPPGQDWSYITCLGYTPQEIFAFGLRSISTKLRRAGILPAEVTALVKLGYADSPDIQAERLFTMIKGSVVGTDQPPQVDEKTMDVVFDSVGFLADSTRTNHPRTPLTIQWIFSETQPRYLELKPGELPLVQKGQAVHPNLTLRCRAADWIRISSGQLKSDRALLTRRLRPSGDLRLLFKLPSILPG